MKQPIKGKRKESDGVAVAKKGRRHVFRGEYGTSKLERDFARDFLDSNGIRYIYQYHAEDIGRFFDFAITADRSYPFLTEEKHGLTSVRQNGQPFKVEFIIEVDGDYHHANPELVDESKLNPMQKHNRMVDAIKDRWCAMHCIPLMRVWESDIRKNPGKVLKQLSRYIHIAEKSERRRKSMRRPH